MELWELNARESIRDLVARYNANGDTGRFAHVVELFAPDAVMETQGGAGTFVQYRGHQEIESIFTGAKEHFGADAAERSVPPYLRHHTSTLQIDLVDQTHGRGRCYYQVLMAHGLDHWGRYMDTYEERDGRWVFTYRKVTTDGRSALVPRS
jgi:hypothetical protein